MFIYPVIVASYGVDSNLTPPPLLKELTVWFHTSREISVAYIHTYLAPQPMVNELSSLVLCVLAHCTIASLFTRMGPHKDVDSQACYRNASLLDCSPLLVCRFY